MNTTDTTPTDVSTLLAKLTALDKDVRQEAALALGEFADDRTAPTLAARLWDEPDFFVRETLTWALTRVAAAAWPAVVEALADPRPQVRVQALHVLSKFADIDTVESVLPLLDDESESVAEKARWTLSRIGDPSVVPHLALLLGKGDAETRNSLTSTLAAFDAGAVPTMIEALNSPNKEIRRHAADVLCHIGMPAAEVAVSALGQTLQDEDSDVAMAALMALGELHSDAADHLVDEVRDSAKPTLSTAAQRLIEKRSARSNRAARLRELRNRNK